MPFSFLILNNGAGVVWNGDNPGSLTDKNVDSLSALMELIKSGRCNEEFREAEIVRLDDNRHLAAEVLGSFKQHPRIARFRKFAENWNLSCFSTDAVRTLPPAYSQKHPNICAGNLANVVLHMEREQPERLRRVLSIISREIPEITKIGTKISPDGKLLLEFFTHGFDTPFSAQQMSDGILKFLTYLLLLEDPDSHSLICIEEPENGLYHKLPDALVKGFRNHASNGKTSSQIFITTNSPYLVNALTPDEVWILEKQKNGFSTVSHVSSNELANNMVQSGIQLGDLWTGNYLSED